MRLQPYYWLVTQSPQDSTAGEEPTSKLLLVVVSRLGPFWLWVESFISSCGFLHKTAYNMEAYFPTVIDESKNKSELDKRVSEF